MSWLVLSIYGSITKTYNQIKRFIYRSKYQNHFKYAGGSYTLRDIMNYVLYCIGNSLSFMHLFTRQLYFPRYLSLLLILGTGIKCMPTQAMDKAHTFKKSSASQEPTPAYWHDMAVGVVLSMDQGSKFWGHEMRIVGRHTLLKSPIKFDIGYIPGTSAVPQIRFPSSSYCVLMGMSYLILQLIKKALVLKGISSFTYPNIYFLGEALFKAGIGGRILDWISRWDKKNKLIYYLCVNNRYVMNLADINLCLGYCIVSISLGIRFLT